MVNIWKLFPNNGFSIKNQPLLGNINHIYWRIVYHWFVVWNHGILWLSHHIGKFIIPTDELIFFRGIGIPPTSNAKWRMVDWWWLMINDTDDGNKDDTMKANNKYNQKNNWWWLLLLLILLCCWDWWNYLISLVFCVFCFEARFINNNFTFCGVNGWLCC